MHGFATENSTTTHDTLPLWIGALDHDERLLVRHAMVRAGFAEQAHMLVPGAYVGDVGRSRQARSAQCLRARSSAAVSCLLLSADDADVRRFLLSRSGAMLRLLSADVHTKANTLRELSARFDLLRCEQLFDAASEVLVSLAPTLHCAPDLEALRVHSALACLTFCALAHAESLCARWSLLRASLAREPSFAAPHLALRLAHLGTWFGDPEPLGALMLEPALRDARLCDALYFVRADVGAEIYTLGGALVRGEPLSPRALLASTRPAAILRRGIDYVIACVRATRHLHSATKSLALFTLLDDTLSLLADLRRQGHAPRELNEVIARIATLELVQRMDKNRFWQLHDGLADGAVKARMGALWNTDYARAGERALG